MSNPKNATKIESSLHGIQLCMPDKLTTIYNYTAPKQYVNFRKGWCTKRNWHNINTSGHASRAVIDK